MLPHMRCLPEFCSGSVMKNEAHIIWLQALLAKTLDQQHAMHTSASNNLGGTHPSGPVSHMWQ